jgi:hypothetical protein
MDENNTGHGIAFFQSHCSELIKDRPHLIFQSAWIRPEDLRRYGEVTNYFKVSGRRNPKWAEMSRAYMEESWDGNLLDLLEPSAVYCYAKKEGLYIDNKELGEQYSFDKLAGCDKNCDACDYCHDLASKFIRKQTVN